MAANLRQKALAADYAEIMIESLSKNGKKPITLKELLRRNGYGIVAQTMPSRILEGQGVQDELAKNTELVNTLSGVRDNLVLAIKDKNFDKIEIDKLTRALDVITKIHALKSGEATERKEVFSLTAIFNASRDGN